MSLRRLLPNRSESRQLHKNSPGPLVTVSRREKSVDASAAVRSHVFETKVHHLVDSHSCSESEVEECSIAELVTGGNQTLVDAFNFVGGELLSFPTRAFGSTGHKDMNYPRSY